MSYYGASSVSYSCSSRSSSSSSDPNLYWVVENSELYNYSTNERFEIGELISNNRKNNELYEFLIFSGMVNQDELAEFTKIKGKLEKI
jgi:hypothetical protein